MELLVHARDVFGSKLRSLREDGFIPAELYGRDTENVHVSVLKKDFGRVYKDAGYSSLVDLVLDGSKTPVLIYAIDKHPVTGEIMNVDFYKVRMDEAVEADISFEFIHESSAVKDEHGILVTVLQDVTVEALPADMPRHIQVDLSKLKHIDDAITIGDLEVGDKIKILADVHSVVVMVKAQVTEEEEAAQQAEGVDVSKIEVVGEKEKSEEKAEEAVSGKEEK